MEMIAKEADLLKYKLKKGGFSTKKLSKSPLHSIGSIDTVLVKLFSSQKVTFGHFFEGIRVLKNVKRSCLIPILELNFRKKIFEKMSESNLLARKNFFGLGHGNKWAIVRGP